MPSRSPLVVVLLALPGCGGEDAIASETLTVFMAPPSPPPVDNPVTPDKVALGRMLYHEKRLSADGTVSCSVCHDLARFGIDGKKVSEGVGGAKGERNAPTVLNAALHLAQFWDGRAATVEDQAIGPVLNPIEHGIESESTLVATLKAIPEVVEAFEKAYPAAEDPVTAANFQKAIGAFERTLTTRSRFDALLDGDQSALDAAEKRGLETFVETGCITCHMGRLVGAGLYRKLGLVNPYPTEDPGRFEVTGREEDRGVFKVPSLLNVAETAPYFHDGSIPTLEEAVRKMAWHQLGKKLSAAEVSSIVTFLGALTGEVR